MTWLNWDSRIICGREGRKRGREGGRKEGREGGRKKGRKEGREEGRNPDPHRSVIPPFQPYLV